MGAFTLSSKKTRDAFTAATEAVDVDALTNMNEVVRDAHAVFDGSSIAMDRSGLVCNADAQAYLRPRSSQATSDIDAVSDGELVVKNLSEMMAEMVAGGGGPLPIEVQNYDCRSQTSVLSSSGVRDADTHAIRSHIQEPQALSNGLLSHLAENQNFHVDTLIELLLRRRTLGC